ncbi:GNAT family N-acetyltransferase [Streptomyces sp. NPDC088197]|uniref:GNAT family N-acetyltransferase n=1 Tax=unclassified Streptomyces TaxID=2593676 RepID=UPI0033A27483
MSDGAASVHGDVTVTDAPESKRYEARIGDDIAGVAAYLRTPDMIAFIHTEVKDAYEGRGVGSALARTALDAARAQGLRVLAICPFFEGWLGKHPEYADLLYVPASNVSD